MSNLRLEFPSLDKVKLAKDYVLVSVDSGDNKMNYGSLELIKDVRYSEITDNYIPGESYLITKGIVQRLPIGWSRGFSDVNFSNLSEGDTVYCHHFLCSPENEVLVGDEVMYRFKAKVDFLTFSRSNLFLKEKSDNSFEMIDRWILCKQKVTKKYDTKLIYIPNNEKKEDKRYIVHKTSDKFLTEGDEIYVDKGRAYKIIIDDVQYCLIDRRHVLANVSKE